MFTTNYEADKQATIVSHLNGHDLAFNSLCMYCHDDVIVCSCLENECATETTHVNNTLPVSLLSSKCTRMLCSVAYSMTMTAGATNAAV